MEKVARHSKTQSKLLQNALINEEDVMKIWDALSHYLRDELAKKKGIVIPGFGTFTYVEQRLEIGNKKQLLKLKPFFQVSDKFEKTHNVEFGKEYVNTAIPVTRICYTAIAEITRKYSREVVETVLNESFAAINHFIRAEGVISIPFKGVGVLKISDVIPKPKKQGTFIFSAAMANYLPIY